MSNKSLRFVAWIMLKSSKKFGKILKVVLLKFCDSYLLYRGCLRPL